MNRKYPILILTLCACCAFGCRHVRVTDHTWTTPRPIGDLPVSTPAAATVDKQPEPGTPRPPAAETGPGIATTRPTKSLEGYLAEVNGQLQDVFFTYDRSEITPDGLTALRHDVDFLLPLLSEFPQVKLVVEGHCDERGSAEYNLGLGDHRAAHVAGVLREFGVLPDCVEIISYGKEAPQCIEPAESCWRRNRRAHLVLR
jgi:peptidoglycan-associated lipoprotein